MDEAVDWHQVGASIPQAPVFEATNLANCQHRVRPAALPEDEQVEAAGWMLTNAAQMIGPSLSKALVGSLERS